jgi:pimeloyl-ACP methyl ester carboxylesterase
MSAIPVPGFDAAARLAASGFTVWGADFEGTGASTAPPDGRAVTTSSQVEAMGAVVAALRQRAGVERVDVIGESWGGGIAAELCADPVAVRSCVLSTMTYQQPPPPPGALFSALGTVLGAMPDGYWTTIAPLYAALVATSPLAVQLFVYGSQPGRYPVTQFTEYAGRPWFDPHRARVPALVIRGAADPITSEADNLGLVAAYGGPARYVAIAGGHHLPRLERGPADAWWREVLAFLASPG